MTKAPGILAFWLVASLALGCDDSKLTSNVPADGAQGGSVTTGGVLGSGGSAIGGAGGSREGTGGSMTGVTTATGGSPSTGGRGGANTGGSASGGTSGTGGTMVADAATDGPCILPPCPLIKCASGYVVSTPVCGCPTCVPADAGTPDTVGCTPVLCPAIACLDGTIPNPDPCGCPICGSPDAGSRPSPASAVHCRIPMIHAAAPSARHWTPHRTR